MFILLSFNSQEIKLYRRSETTTAAAEAEKCSSDAQNTACNLRVKKNKAVQPRQQATVKVTFHNEAQPAEDSH